MIQVAQYEAKTKAARVRLGEAGQAGGELDSSNPWDFTCSFMTVSPTQEGKRLQAERELKFLPTYDSLAPILKFLLV